MPMMDLPMMTGDQVVFERRAGEGGNRGLSPITAITVSPITDGGQGLARSVHVGAGDANTYPYLTSVLERLGIGATNATNHEDHFHLYLRPPVPQSVIVSSNLMGPSADETSQSSSDAQYDHVLSVCDRVDLDASSLGGGGLITPAERVRQFLSSLYKQPEYRLPADTTLTVISGFKHGEIRSLDETILGPLAFQYILKDKKEFLNNSKHGGIDHAVLEVTVQGKKIKVIYKVLGDWAFTTEDPAEGRARKEICPFKIREIGGPRTSTGRQRESGDRKRGQTTVSSNR
jgi:hypothetical protein